MRLFPIWYTPCKMHFNKRSYTLMYYLAKWVHRTYCTNSQKWSWKHPNFRPRNADSGQIYTSFFKNRSFTNLLGVNEVNDLFFEKSGIDFSTRKEVDSIPTSDLETPIRDKSIPHFSKIDNLLHSLPIN